MVWEAKADIPKNRKDDRHHALDAMLINFLPQWSRDTHKQHFFRFPDAIQANPQAFFRREIDSVTPCNIAFEKPALEDTIYGSRQDSNGLRIVKRKSLFALAMRSSGLGGKAAFDAKYLADQLKTVRDARIVAEIKHYLAESEHGESSWKKFCDTLHLSRKDGSKGPRVLKVNVNVGAPDEYVDLSKDQLGGFRKGSKHRGQIIYLLRKKDKKGAIKETVCVRPVYAFESRHQAEKSLREEHGDAITIYGFFQSGCLVALKKNLIDERGNLSAGTYRLNTIKADGRAKLTDQRGQETALYAVSKLIAVGFKRVR